MLDLTVPQIYAAMTMGFTATLAVLTTYACGVWPFSPKACAHPGCSQYEKPVRYCPNGHPMKPGYTGPIKSKATKGAPPAADV